MLTRTRLLNTVTIFKTKRLRLYCDSAKCHECEVQFSNGRKLKLSTGKYAKLADGCAVGTLGDTSVMVTAVAKTKPSPGNFVPLIVDYRQKSAAAGRIPTNFLRRELGATEPEILTSRVIDRSLRPLFKNDFNYETQLVCNMLAVDSVNSPDVISINTASAALTLSDIPWNGPVGAVRLGFVNNEVVINPTRKELQLSNLNLIITATKQNLVVMLEGSADNILQQDLLKAIKTGVKETQLIIAAIEKLQKAVGKPKRTIDQQAQLSEELVEAIQSLTQMRVREIFTNYSHDKLSRDNAISEVRSNVFDKIKLEFPNCDPNLTLDCFNKITKQVFRDLVFEQEKRCDGREFSQLRDISCQVDLYKPLHGCSVFQRGQTQVFCTVTLDSHDSSLKLDPVSMLTSGIKQKNFFLHYEFPPYATKETGKIGPLGRREMGHGALAEKALAPTVPNDFPFTIRLTSEVLESNGKYGNGKY